MIRLILLIYSLPEFDTRIIRETSESPWILTTSVLPSQSKFLATLGNGQLALTPYLKTQNEDGISPSLFVNCFYNGQSWTSHRARIPNYANYLPNFAGQTPTENSFSLNLERGEFVARNYFEDFEVEHKIIIHRNNKWKGTVVNIFTASTNDSPSDKTLDFEIELQKIIIIS